MTTPNESAETPVDPAAADEPERPAQHGGGESGPPIAGDPSSFPSDAELARTLCWQRSRATLSTLTADGFPYGSVVSYAPDHGGAPVVLVSDMAEHTVNARRDTRASMLITAAASDGDADPLGMARCTLVGHMELVDDQASVREAYLERHPYAGYYVDFTDFGFWRLDVSQIRYVGGFGHMSWVSARGEAPAHLEPVAQAPHGIVEHQ
ncbi:MAG: pyridoxamine 5'-phosphate oxidase family protein [Actinomycetota bacterium]